MRFWVWFDALRTCGFVRSELSLCLLLLCSDSVLSLASACSLCEDLHRAVETIVESVSGSLPDTPGELRERLFCPRQENLILMIRSAGREQSEIAVISCQDQGWSAARVLPKDWYQLAVASTYKVCGAVDLK